MKKIEVIIPSTGFNELDSILKGEHVGGVSYSKIEGRGKSKAEQMSTGRGTTKYTPEYLQRLKVEVVVKDSQMENLVARIVTGLGGSNLDGKIFVVDVPLAVDLKTKQKDESAV